MDTLADVLGEEPLHKQAIEEEVKQKGKNLLDIEEQLTLVADKKYWPFDDKMQWKFYRKLAKIDGHLLPGYDPAYIEERWWRQPAQDTTSTLESNTQSSQDQEKKQSEQRLNSEMDFFIRKLNSCESKAEADEVSTLFYTVLNTREHKHRLVRALLAAPRQQLNLIPIYCRFLANLNFDLPKVSEKVLDGLKQQLHRRKKDLKYLEEKVRNVRYLGELTKFDLIPPSEIVQFFKEFSEDYEGHSIDLVIVILECCGRYLKRSETMSQKFLTILNKMWKIRNTKKVPQGQLYDFQNAYFFLFPKSIMKKQKKQRPILLQYIRHLLFERLSQDNVEEIGDLLSRMPWEEPEVEPYIFKCLLKIAFTGKFTTVNVLASLLKEMTKFYPQLVIRFIDALIQDIQEEAENNDFQMSQHRVLVMRCLGELYNYGVVTSPLVFDVMRELLQEVHRVEQKQQQQEKKQTAERALLNDGFHIRLVCTVLQTCHLKFTSSPDLKQLLAQFLEEFQNTVLRQSYVSMDLQFQILDTLDLYRPSLNRYTDLKEIKGLSTQLMESLEQPLPPPEEKKMVDLGNMQITKDQEFETQLSQLITESLKEANKERIRAPPMLVKGKKALKQQRPLKKLMEQAIGLEGDQKGMIVLTKAKTKNLARIEIPSQSALMMARGDVGQSEDLKENEEEDETDQELKRKTLMLAGGGLHEH